MNAPETGKQTLTKLPASNYYCETHYQNEIEAVFRKTWLNICREDDLPNPGDFITYDLHDVGAPIIIARGKDQKLRAFYNMCTHRGNVVEMAKKGNRKGFKCNFHGWTFDLEGQLVALPEQQYFPQVDCAEEHLVTVHCDTWGGFVYINLCEGEPEWTLAEFHEPLTESMGELMGDRKWYRTHGYQATVNCNWKLPYDALIEFYHFAALHPKTVGGGLSLKGFMPTIFSDSPGSVGFFESYYAPETATESPTPIQELTTTIGNFGLYVQSKAPKALGDTSAINQFDRPDWGTTTYAFIPNVCIMPVGLNGLALQRAWPIGPDKCTFEILFYSMEPQPPSDFVKLFCQRAAQYNNRDIASEDFSTLERIQRNLKRAPVKSFHFGMEEAVNHALQEQIQRHIDRHLARAAQT
ncbi:MAG: aromatic ring-hydroxylating dioxygenase subunit alpha [Gammaproteobacteria bacterium]|nr:aromatic ring-hydroxylating dioxygenase subunit alpha [Gammaproteobacteria bacterium]